jgi:predicted RNA-binding Zn-ribbon protein involved in translation (DUF1610 family)
VSDIYVGIREEREETEDRKDESVLRQHVCPSCGNVDILIGDEEFDKDVKPILAGDKLDEGVSFYRCAGGFGEFAYRYLPHKCTACGARFTAVKKEKAKPNKEALGWCVAFAFVVAAHIALSMVLIAHGCPAVAAFCGITAITLIVYANILSKIDENTYDKDPGPEYICEYGLSDAAFRRLEMEYDERLKDLKAKEAFSDEELEELVKAEDSEDACDAPKKSVQDIYGTLTPEQRAVVHYLVGDAVKSVDKPKETEKEMELLKQQLQAQFGDPLPELLKQRLQVQHYILQAADPRQIYADGNPLLCFPQPTIRPWDIHPW